MAKYTLTDGTSVWRYCKENKLSDKYAYRYIAAGGTPDEAVKFAYDRKYNKKWQYQVGNQSLNQYCVEKGYCYTSIYRLVKEGMTMEQAIEYYEKNKGNKSHPKHVLPTGETLKAYCEKKGICWITIYGHMRKFNLTPVKALERIGQWQQQTQ